MTLQTSLQEAEQILQHEFGFRPEQTRLVFHSKNSWNKFLVNRNSNPQGVFQPRFLTAHIPKNPSQTLLARTIHEYLGHGSYCEHSRNGRRIVQFEQELKDLETKLAGVELPKNRHIILVENEMTLLQDPISPNIVLPISKDPQVTSYLELQKRYKQFFEQNLLTYEGFAIWLEEFLLKQLNQEGSWGIRSQEINPAYQQFYQEFKRFEQESGQLSLIYKVGFPRLFDQEHILKLVREYLDLNKLSLLILYGSQKPYGDIDLVAISRDLEPKSVFSEEVDLAVLTEEEFNRRFDNFDIGITEPLLKGKPIVGEDIFRNLRGKLSQKEFKQGNSEFLKKKAVELYQSAHNYFNQAIQSSNPIYFLISLTNLSYVWCYLVTSRLYNHIRPPILFRDLLPLSPQLSHVIQYTKAVKEGKIKLDPQKIKSFLEEIPYSLQGL